MHDMEKITEQTVALQIRDFPVSLSRRMRARATLLGITTRDVVVAALEKYLPPAEEEFAHGRHESVDLQSGDSGINSASTGTEQYQDR